MNIKLIIGDDELSVECPEEDVTVADVIDLIEQDGEELLEENDVDEEVEELIECDLELNGKTVMDMETPVQDGDKIEFLID